MPTTRTAAALSRVPVESVTVNERAEIVARHTSEATLFAETLPGGATLELVAIPAGSFLMGSPPGPGFDDERPQHAVRLPAFYLGRYPVTQTQWAAVMGTLPPCRTPGPNRPVDRVSWRAAQTFCERLAAATGRAYRLPSEAEWEYACRAGTTGPFSCGPTLSTDLANYVGNYVYRQEPPGPYRHGSTDVGSFAPNPFGLYDMHGNVWEWCADAWHPGYAGGGRADAPTDGAAWAEPHATAYVLRGGCWHDPPNLCRCAARLRSLPEEGEDYFGLRVALGDLTARPTAALSGWALAARVAARVASRLAAALLRRGG